MFIISVTGRLASGKSTVARLLAARGGYLVDADQIAREALKKGTAWYYSVIKHFGSSVVRNNGEIDRKKLADKVFASKDDLLALEKIIHPYVTGEIRKRLLKAEAGGHRFAVIDIPLLEKSGILDDVDFTVFVSASQENILSRAVAAGFDRDDAIKRLKTQPTPEELRELADAEVDNNGSLDDLRKQIDELFEKRISTNIRR